MKPLRFTTSASYGMLDFNEHDPLVDPADRGELIESKTQFRGAYIHGQAEELAKFDIPIFIDGDMAQLDRSVEEQEIIMILPSGQYPCKAEKCYENGSKNKYLITLKSEPSINHQVNEESEGRLFDFVNQIYIGKVENSLECYIDALKAVMNRYGEPDRNRYWVCTNETEGQEAGYWKEDSITSLKNFDLVAWVNRAFRFKELESLKKRAQYYDNVPTGGTFHLSRYIDELEEWATQEHISKQEKGGDNCVRCGNPIDHNDPHMYCSNCE